MNTYFFYSNACISRTRNKTGYWWFLFYMWIASERTCSNISAFMPAPIIYGRIVDSTCMLWQSCGNSGACVLHDLFDFRLKLHLISLTFQVIASLSTAFALWWTWKWRDWSDRKQITFDVDKNILITKKKIQGQSDIIRVEKPVWQEYERSPYNIKKEMTMNLL